MKDAPRIQPVVSGRDRRDFIRVPSLLRRGDPRHVQVPFVEERRRFGRANPYFDHAEAAFLLARASDGRPVGRVSAQIDSLAPRAAGGGTAGHFGCLEAADEPVLAALLGAAEAWLAARGAVTIGGPYSLSINEEVGLLVEGHEEPPSLLMNWAPPWYGEAIERLGFARARDLLAFHVDVSRGAPERARELASRALEIDGLSERPMDPRRFDEEIATVVRLFNDAWSENWGFVPMTDAEIARLAASFRSFLPPDFVRLVEIDGEPVAMIVALPDLNEAFAGASGRLLPFGWVRLLWRMKVRGFSRARVILMGISRAWGRDLRSAALAALLTTRIHEALERAGFRDLEMSWVLEDNRAMIRLIEMLGGVRHKRYRLYEKPVP